MARKFACLVTVMSLLGAPSSWAVEAPSPDKDFKAFREYFTKSFQKSPSMTSSMVPIR